MNEHSSTDTSAAPNVAPDAVSRRAYELWEKEGRPEGCDMRHWLQAEQELAQSRSSGSSSTPAARHTDVAPLQGTRAGAAMTANRDLKRTTTSALPSNGTGVGNGQNSGKRKPTSAPAL